MQVSANCFLLQNFLHCNFWWCKTNSKRLINDFSRLMFRFMCQMIDEKWVFRNQKNKLYCNFQIIINSQFHSIKQKRQMTCLFRLIVVIFMTSSIRFELINWRKKTREDVSMLKVSFIQMNLKLRHALCTDQINYLGSDKLHFALHHINYRKKSEML